MINRENNPLPGVPWVESPFFEELMAGEDPRVLAVARSMREHGFAVIEFPDEEFTAVAERMKRNLSARFAEEEWARFSRSGGGMRLWDAWKYDEDVLRLARNRTILALLSRIYGRQARPFQTLNFPVGTEQHVHSDAVHFHSMPERFMCGVWVALEDITPENGPLLYYPGSHRWSAYANEHAGHYVSDLPVRPSQDIYHRMWNELIRINKARSQTFLAKRGQALIWCANLLHGGSPHLDRQKTRWSQVTHYYFDDCTYYTPMWSDVPAGRIYYRQLNEVGGDKLVNQCIGREVDPRYLAAARSGRYGGEFSDFDGAAYLAANPDVAAAGRNPYEHYMLSGWQEGRPLR